MATACPRCGASVRPGAPYCSLCHADFRPRPAVVEPPAPAPVAAVPVPAPAPLVPAPRTEPRWPCLSCQVSNPMSVDVCLGCGSAFLAGAREELSVVVPGVGDLVKMSRGQRLALVAGAMAVVLVPVAVLTLLLSPPAPPAEPGTGTSTVVVP